MEAIPTSKLSNSQISDMDFTNLVTVVVGSEETRTSFTVYRDLVVQRSGYFRAALCGCFQEATTKVVPLPEVEPDLFQRYLRWISTGEVIHYSFEDTQPYDPSYDGEPRLYRLASLYILGDYLQDFHLRNKVIDGFIATCKVKGYGPSSDVINLIWEHTSADCKLRQVVFSWEVADSNVRFLKESLAEDRLNSQYIADLLIHYAEIHRRCDEASLNKPDRVRRCAYHDHEGTARCGSQTFDVERYELRKEMEQCDGETRELKKEIRGLWKEHNAEDNGNMPGILGW